MTGKSSTTMNQPTNLQLPPLGLHLVFGSLVLLSTRDPRPMPKPNMRKKVFQAATGFLLGGAAAAACIAATRLGVLERQTSQCYLQLGLSQT